MYEGFVLTDCTGFAHPAQHRIRPRPYHTQADGRWPSSDLCPCKVRAGFPAEDRLFVRAFTCMHAQPILRRGTRLGGTMSFSVSGKLVQRASGKLGNENGLVPSPLAVASKSAVERRSRDAKKLCEHGLCVLVRQKPCTQLLVDTCTHKLPSCIDFQFWKSPRQLIYFQT